MSDIKKELILRMKLEMYEELKEIAENNFRTVTSQILVIINDYIKKEKSN